jgi:hypothetical protein
MSYYDYKIGREISQEDYPFYALIQAAMRQADTVNQGKLAAAFPEIWTELQTRYHRPGGLLEGET